MAGVRLLNEPMIPKKWVASMSGSAKGALDLNIEPYQIDDVIYSHIFGVSGSGSVPDVGIIDIEGFFFLAPGNRAYGIYEIRGALTETGNFSGTLNITSGKLSFQKTSDNGNEYTVTGQKVNLQ
jgi:hypothetical protein